MSVSVKSIDVGSVENVLTALQGIGFTIDSENNTAKWPYDTNNKLYFKAESNTTLKIYNSSDTIIGTGISLNGASNYKIVYERIGNSIIFGFGLIAQTGNSIQLAVIEPKDAEDEWKYLQAYTGAPTLSISRIFDAKTEESIAYGTTPLYNGSANGIQLSKFYDGYRFTGNIFITTACAAFQNAVNANSNIASNNYLDADISSDRYLLINMTNATTGNKIAIKRPSA